MQKKGAMQKKRDAQSQGVTLSMLHKPGCVKGFKQIRDGLIVSSLVLILEQVISIALYSFCLTLFVSSHLI